MKVTIFFGAVVLIALFGLFVVSQNISAPPEIAQQYASSTDAQPAAATSSFDTIPAMTVIAENFSIPWDIVFLPDGDMLVTERGGKLLVVGMDGSKREIPTNRAVRHTGESGLLGVVLHPDFAENGFIYLYFTAPSADGETVNQVERYRFDGEKLSERKLIVGDIPGAIYHDGGRMEFGPDGMLYVTTGDATRENIAQDLDSLGGKILRMKDDGSIPDDNPFDTLVYSYGHRNPQGIAWDSAGRLWETEHGRSGVVTGMDEINLIKPGLNYGWPDIEGDETKAKMEKPKRHSGANDTWAPASAAILGNKLYFGGLRGEALYEATLSGENVTALVEHFKGEFGRIRTVRVGPDGMLYLTTSNHDGRGDPAENDDRIIRVNPTFL